MSFLAVDGFHDGSMLSSYAIFAVVVLSKDGGIRSSWCVAVHRPVFFKGTTWWVLALVYATSRITLFVLCVFWRGSKEASRCCLYRVIRSCVDDKTMPGPNEQRHVTHVTSRHAAVVVEEAREELTRCQTKNCVVFS